MGKHFLWCHRQLSERQTGHFLCHKIILLLGQASLNVELLTNNLTRSVPASNRDITHQDYWPDCVIISQNWKSFLCLVWDPEHIRRWQLKYLAVIDNKPDPSLMSSRSDTAQFLRFFPRFYRESKLPQLAEARLLLIVRNPQTDFCNELRISHCPTSLLCHSVGDQGGDIKLRLSGGSIMLDKLD